MDDYRGVILAGGKGTRMGELTRRTNKHMLPVGNFPMIYYPLKKLVAAGVTEILLVAGLEHVGDFIELLGSGREHGCRLTYRVQDEAGGIAQALGLADGFCCGNFRPVVILGDNIFENPLGPILHEADKAEGHAMVVLKVVPDPHRYGVAETAYDMAAIPGTERGWAVRTDRPPRVVSIEEKPSKPKSDLAVTGIYVYPTDVFQVIGGLKPSARGELEITDVNNYYLRQRRLEHWTLQGYWTDAGTIPSWHLANRLVTGSDPFKPDEVLQEVA